MEINKKHFPNKVMWATAVTLIFLLAGFLRFYGLNWDEGFNYTPHPDERAILMKVMDLSPVEGINSFFDKDNSGLNPRWFAYGSFPLYLLKSIYSLFGKIELFEQYDIRTIGRAISGMTDLITLGLVYLIGKRLSNKIVGLVAASLLAVSVISIQNSHFYTVDSLLTLFITASVYLAIEFAKTGKARYLALTGVMIGFALGCKVSALPICFSPIAAIYVYFLTNKTKGIDLGVKDFLMPVVYCFSCVFLVLVTIQPYMILDWVKYKTDILEQAEVVWRIRDYPYTRQYIGTTPYIYQLLQLMKWGLGVPLGLFVITGLIGQFVGKMGIKLNIIYIVAAVVVPGFICTSIPYPYGQTLGLGVAFFSLLVFFHFRNRGEGPLLIVLAWLVPYLIVTGALEAKFLRYLLPAIPSLIVISCVWMNGLFGNSIFIGEKSRIIPGLFYGLLFSATLVQALAFVSIYGEKHTAVRASEWVNNNVEPGSVLIKEHWEESIPKMYEYEINELQLYEDDTQIKFEQISSVLSAGDYLIIFSNRLYGTIPRLPERYPITLGYYQALFKEQLGYSLVKEASQKQYPEIFGISFINDTYSKPNLKLAEPEQYRGTVVNLGYLDESLTVYDHPKVLIFKNTGNLNREQIKEEILKEAVIQGAGEEKHLNNETTKQLRIKEKTSNQWNELFSDETLSEKYPLLVWGIAIIIIGLISLPTTLILFKNLSDKGYGLTKILGISVVGFLVWSLVSWGIFEYSSVVVIISVLLVLAANTILFIFKRKELISLFKRYWQIFTIEETIFVLAFIAFVALRMFNPDLWHPYRGGEKPMELAHINALTRSLYLPPYDPWYSGGVLNYYYYGHFLVTNLIKICGIVPTTAFNLAIPTFFAMAASASFSLGFNIFSGTITKKNNLLKRVKSNRPITWTATLAGLTAMMFVCLLGNLDGAAQILSGIWDKLINGSAWMSFDYWKSSRMMPPDPPGFEVTEFPFFTFLFADLHPHLISIPFTLLLLGIMLALVVSSVGKTSRKMISANEALLIITMAIVLGSVRVINAWDFPTYFVLGCSSLMLHELFVHGGAGIVVVGRWLLKALILYLLSFLAFMPFYTNYENFYSSLEPTTNKTDLGQAGMILGVFLTILISYFFINRKGIYPFSDMKTISITPRRALYIVLIAMLVGYLVSGPGKALLGNTAMVALFIMGAIGYTVISLLKKFDYEAKYRAFNFLILLMAFAIIFGVEIVRITGDIDRMNTVFKFYLQAWVLLGIGCSYLFWHSFYKIKRESKNKIDKLGFLASTLLICCGIIYPIFATPVRIDDRFIQASPTLDGKAYMADSVYVDQKGEVDLSFDYEAITWMNKNLLGTPVVLEANTPMYRWGSRISVYTGFPTILGWKWHQEQQRMNKHSEIQRRILDISTIYETKNIEKAITLIKKYEVEYIYIGRLEKLYYSSEGLNKFQSEMKGVIETVYSNKEVEIYKVN